MNPLFDGFQRLREALGLLPWRTGLEFWREEPRKTLTRKQLLEFGVSEKDASYGNLLVQSHMRSRCIERFGFAIPTDEALDAIAAHSPIVEMGAGLGYWASLLQARGCSVACFDQHPVGPGSKNTYSFKHSEPYTKVHQGSFEVLQGCVTDGYASSALLLIWPNYNDPFADNCLTAYRGDTVIYVGEGNGGCTADDTFEARLNYDWTETRSIVIPQWWGIHDYLRIFKRGAPADQVVPAECDCPTWRPAPACLYCWRKGLTLSQKVDL